MIFLYLNIYQQIKSLKETPTHSQRYNVCQQTFPKQKWGKIVFFLFSFIKYYWNIQLTLINFVWQISFILIYPSVNRKLLYNKLAIKQRQTGKIKQWEKCTLGTLTQQDCTKTLFSLSKHSSQRAGFLLFMPLLLSESSLSLGYKPQLTSLTLFAFIICYFCRCPSMSTPEITTPTPFFFLLSKMGHFQPQGQTFHSQIILDFRSLQPSFFLPF